MIPLDDVGSVGNARKIDKMQSGFMQRRNDATKGNKGGGLMLGKEL